MKKLIVSLLLFTTTLFSQTDPFTTADDIDLLLKDDFFQGCQLAVDAYDLTAKEIIYRHNKKLLMRPASNMKILTTSTALYFLGSDFTFKTIIAHDGEIDDSVLVGNLYFIGGFDPDFTSEDLDTMIMQLKDEGIAKIEGNLYGDVSKMDSLYWGNGWMWDDDPATDFPYMTPLVINDAAVKVVVKPTTVGNKPEVSFIPDLFKPKFINNAVTVKGDSSDLAVTRDWLHNSDKIIVRDSVGIDDEPDTTAINLSRTNNYFLSLARATLEKHGITVKGKCDTSTAPEDVEVLIEHERPFSEVIVNLNKTSDNLSAEMTLRALAYQFNGKGASAKEGVKIIDSLITIVGLSQKDYRLVDGSGVSHYNLVTVELLNEILKYFYFEKEDLYQILYDSFPIGGVDGTLKGRMKEPPTYENVHAKTGTLSAVSSLAGYLTAKNGHMISFSINTQSFVGSARTARDFQDKICEILANIDD
ncbi:D-alanyl-D-alanine carboxypeptidase [hydrothermal vent metagenome]|uniref:D-alanyl-D-alanine carboxypeptidase n=1 Tax=hydrothermal vent metagenome TaxID=652676 RepID=A0A3B1BRZ9_9ZZZZ